jgi:hypothetical protein
LYRNERCLRTTTNTTLLGMARIMDRVGVMNVQKDTSMQKTSKSELDLKKSDIDEQKDTFEIVGYGQLADGQNIVIKRILCKR